MNFLLSVIAVFLTLASLVSSASKGTQPKILSRYGQLIFEVPSNRNISFRTAGSGCVHVNGVDLTTAAKLAKNVSDLIETYRETFDETISKIDDLDQVVHGPTGLIRRVQNLEIGGGNTTRRPPPRPRPTRLANITRSVRALEQKVDDLIKLLEKDDCVSNPCDNGGTCTDIFNGFLCDCPDGWQGRQCKEDVNECAIFIGSDLGCQNGATCINKQGTYECQCPHGWYGIHCTSRTNDCSTGGSRLCGPHGTCVQQNTDEGYKCICNQGWEPDETGLNCKDVDECTTSTHLCSKDPPVECRNTQGSYTCGNCPAGFTGSGFACTDIDECVSFNNGGCSVNPRVECINTRGSRRCASCPVGYSGDGVICVYTGDACSYNNGGCHPLAQCRANPSISASFTSCMCPPGYNGNGIGPNGCVGSGIPQTACQNNPCRNGGVCMASFNVSSGYICRCPPPYVGINCESTLNTCSPNPCLNGGTCTSIGPMVHRCICSSTYYGSICQNRRQTCGGKFTNPEGTLKFPLDNSIVDRSRPYSCPWIIETNVTKVVKLHFKEFKLEGTQNCVHDWLEIHEGTHTGEHSLGRFCGETLPKGGDIVSSDNAIYLWFRSDHAQDDSHFELEWSTQEPVCGGFVAVNTNGRLASPGSPGKYPNNRDCYWTLEALTGKRILFSFFDINFGPNNTCDKDYVEFIAGFDKAGEVFAKYCNSSTQPPSPFYSMGSNVVVHFHSDAADRYNGFKLSYSLAEGMPGCGGVFTENSGQLTLPTLENKYRDNLLCEYKIQLPLNDRIRLTFQKFNLESSDGCRYDSLKIYQGPDTNSPLIGTYCGSDKPAPYLFPTNQVLVVFKSDYSNGAEGFTASYESVCGGIYTEMSGVIETPGYPNESFNTLNCIYEMNIPAGKAIKLHFLGFTTLPYVYSSCEYDDHIEIRDGDSETSKLIGRYCETTPPDIISTHNALWMKYSANRYSKGFRANYTTIDTGCGGILKQEGTISPPTEAGDYLESAYCEWIISAPPGKGVRIHFVTFALEGDQGDCNYDFLRIFENDTSTNRSGQMGEFCGDTKPPDLSSSSNVVTLFFITDNSVQEGPGFLLEYEFYKTNGCGANYYSGAGELTSPNFPNDYPAGLDCTWIITADPNQRIMLNISTFVLEDIGYDCEYDFLEIRYGKTANSPLVGKYCRNIGQIPTRIPSHTNEMFIRFKTDESGQAAGFNITWFTIATGCGGTLTAPSGSVTSPNYPQVYLRNTECGYKIRVNPGSIIQAHFTDMELEESEECGMDYVELYDGPSPQHKLIGKYCEMTDTIFRTSGNTMYVRFYSDVSAQYRGFELKYEADCNFVTRGFSGLIESPNYPYNYPYNEDCTWDIIVPHKNKINITFTNFELEHINYPYDMVNEEDNCRYDFLNIQYVNSYTLDKPKASDSDYTTLGKYCGNTLPPSATINANNLRLHFVTDSSASLKGFQMEWLIFGCGGKMSKASGEIKSPNYPHGYEPDTQCDWLIEVEFGNSIELKFDTIIDLEVAGNCTADYIRLYNGLDSNYTVLTTLCRQDNVTVVTSTGNYMFIEFRANSQHQGKGFSATYTTKPTKCGGKFTASTGVITSPNYPKNYDEGDTCEWLIQVDEGHTIELEFEDVDMVKDYNECDSDYLIVYDGPSTEYKQLQKVCADNKPNSTIRSSSNQMLLMLRTHDYMTAKGFKAKFYKACGAIIVTNGSGQIDYRSTTMYTLRNETCQWAIKTNVTDAHVFLTIGHMEGVFCSQPPGHYPLTIYSGDSSTAPVLHEYCTNEALYNPRYNPSMTSPGNSLYIVIDPRMDFFATYTIFDTECGGTMSSSKGAFASPGYPDVYPADRSCEWTLVMAEGNHVSLIFRDFSLLDSPDCNSDFLEVRSDNSSGKLLGVYCGSNVPTNITDVGSIYVLLKTSSPAQGDIATAKGFYISYYLDRFNELKGPHGIIESPLYPRKYRGTDVFQYRVQVEFGKRMVINFVEFYMDYSVAAEDRECIYSSLEIYDGFDEEAPSLGKYCGFSTPENVTSSSNIVLIKMDNSQTRFGTIFKLEWLETSGSSPTTAKKNKTCGTDDPVDLTTVHIYNLTSPGYPHGYAHELSCEWIFTTIPMNHVELYFTRLDLSPEGRFSAYEYESCFQDYVTIYEGVGGTENWKEKKKVCAPNATYEVFQVNSNLMKVLFTSSYSENGTGFEAKVFEECGGSIRDVSGMIIMDNTTSHMSNYQCQWNVTVRPGRTIKVSFPYFQIGEKSSNCDTYLMLRNGEYHDSPYLGKGKYCGNEAPEELQTTSNYLYIEYVGPHKIKGFHLKFQEVSYECGETIKLDLFSNTTEITSPNYPNVPPSHIECYWIIEAPPGEALRIDFEGKFDIFAQGACAKEYVEIRDGGTKFSTPVGKFCGDAPNSQHTTGNMAHITYFTDQDDPESGFKAKISIATCGGTMRTLEGDIKSPYYKNKKLYPQNTNCTWHLSTPSNHYYILKIVELDLPYSENCEESDHVTIFEQRTRNLHKVRSFCGLDDEPKEITVTNNNVFIQFIAGQTSYHEFNGFKIHYNASEKDCNEKIVASEGQLTTPGYPVLGLEPIMCIWEIEVPKGRRVQFALGDVSLGLTKDSYENYLKFYNDRGFESTILEIESDQITTPVIESTDNIMVVYYGSVGGSTLRGLGGSFSSTERTLCVGSFTDDSGAISNPVNKSSYSCEWKRQESDVWTSINLDEKTLALTVEVSATNSSSYLCLYDTYYLKVKSDTDESLIKGYCEDGQYKEIVRTPLKQTVVQSYGSASEVSVNFTISYRSYACGGILHLENGNIKSPSYPHSPSTQMECSWLIELPSEETLKLTFKDFELDNDCEKNFLEIYNGQYPTAPKIGKFCNNNKPPVIQSQSNYLWIDYHVANGVTAKGFNATYEQVIHGCGGIYHDDTRTIQSPKYPKDYPKNSECVYEINAPVGHHISFHFFDRFHVETSNNCDNDFVEVFNKEDDEWKSLGKECGRNVPTKDYNSTSNYMKIVFRSNNDNNVGTGFKGKWIFVCGGHFKVDSIKRYVTSPNYPKRYKGELQCIFNFTSDDIFHIVFEDFELEGNKPQCPFDYLKLEMPGEYAWARTALTYCGDDMPPSQRVSKKAVLTFKTDYSVSKRGFKFWYKNEECGGTITAPTTIKSPFLSKSLNQGASVASIAKCEWKITAPADRVVTIKLEKVQVEGYCGHTGIIIYQGISEDDRNVTATYCGTIKKDLPMVITKSNEATVEMRGDFWNKEEFLSADILFTYPCGGEFELDNVTQETIQAPNHPDIDCVWVFSAMAGYNIKIEFTGFNLRSNCSFAKNYSVANCPCSFVEVRDGGTHKDALMERICHNTSSANLQRAFITSNRYAYIRVSSVGDNHDAFTAKVSSELSICGEPLRTVTNEVKNITSPNYPNPYPPNRKCSWLLRGGSFRDTIDIHFKEFDLTEDDSDQAMQILCTGDRLAFRQTREEYYYSPRGRPVMLRGRIGRDIDPIVFSGLTPGENQFCGSYEKPFDYYPSGNQVEIIFYSGNSPHKGKGFMLEYKFANCSRNYTALQERIKPGNIDKGCNITIERPPGYTINLYFNSFYLPSDMANNCSDIGMQIFEGDPTGTSLLRTCGYATPNPVFSTTNKLWIHIWRNTSGHNEIDMIYTSTTAGRGCGGSIYNIKGQVTSPMYPFDYRNDTTCTWNLRVPAGMKMALKLDVFDIQAPCTDNWLTVSTYTGGDAANVHKFCKGDKTAILESDSKMTIIYKASRNNGGAGWVAKFIATDDMSRVEYLL